MLVTLIGISIVIFFLLRIVPGNIVDILFDAAGFVDPADKANLERELGIDQPLVVQYLHWIGGLLRGDLGYSYVSEKPALQEILPRIPSRRGSPDWRCCSPLPSAFPWASSARSIRDHGWIMSCAWSASAACRCLRFGLVC
jgi:ABC-type microcin C transport system permease subunit YejB